MTDKEFLELKNRIKEVGNMCHQINSTFRELRIDISELDTTFSKLEKDVHELKNKLSIAEAIRYEW